MHSQIRYLLLLTLAGLISISTRFSVSQSVDPDWQVLAPGIEYRLYQLPDPNNVFVTRLDRRNTNAILESSIAQGKLIEGKETVSGMYERYNQALNFWGGSEKPPSWGMRNQVVVAINGAYFDLSNGEPQGGQVQSGWYAKPYDKLGGWGGFAWKLNRTAFIGECLHNTPEDQILYFPATGKIQYINDINDPANDNELVIYTPQYNSKTNPSPSAVEVLVELRTPAMVLPIPEYAVGVVRLISVGVGNTTIPFNTIVISAVGKQGSALLENVQLESEVRISQQITSYESDCESRYSLNWAQTYASIQGAFFFLKDGDIRDFDDPGAVRRNPRTAIAFNERYVYFIVVDGRDAYHSVGMSIHELAQFSRNILGATYGVAQDGGGSSTMVINGQVINNTYCNIYTCNTDYYYEPPTVILDSFTEQEVIPSEGNVIVSQAGIERAVANGMMMVVAQQAVYSHAFTPGDSVTTNRDVELRLGPGTNYDSVMEIPQGTQGTIADQYNDLEGVLAKSSYWWFVDFGGITGWVTEEALLTEDLSVNTYPMN